MDNSALWKELADRWDTSNDYRMNPAQWISDKTGEFTWSKQREICDSLVGNRYTAVHSAHDLGKSFIASRIADWWIATHPIGEAFVVSTAPTAAQVASILWREIGKGHKKANLDGRINRAGYPQWVIGSELVGYGRKPSDYEESAFQGIHARYVLVIIDEACGVAKHLFDAVDALATNTQARVLAIGNPDDPGSHFASVCKPDSGWNVIHLDGLRSPNMTESRIVGTDPQNPRYPMLAALMEAEGVPYSTEEVPDGIRDLLISELWVEERIQRWAGISPAQAAQMTREDLGDLAKQRCASSPLFLSKVRGIFPTGGSEGVIPLGWVELAVNRWHDIYDNAAGRSASLLASAPGRKVVGADIAREGEDETAVSVRYGNVLEKVQRMRIADTTETADFIASHLHEVGSACVVDVIGIGAGVFDMLRRMKKQNLIQGTPYPFNASAQTTRRDLIGEFRFRNDRSAAWWRMRELLDPSRGSTIALPPDERLIEELVAPRYSHNVGGIIVVESKDDIRKRLGRSTDSADSVIQSFWLEGSTHTLEAYPWSTGGKGSPVQRYSGYNPFTDEDFDTGLGSGTQSIEIGGITAGDWLS